jgi:putative DNA-invertase from lambdoid prophage Rac
MSRNFIYARVSTTDQNTENQIREIEAAGFAVNKRRIVTESISGSVTATERPQFAKLLDRLEPGDVLIVTKLDRLGRNAMDVRSTVDRLATEGVRVHCLALGGVDLTSAAGKMTMGVLIAVAGIRTRLADRTHACRYRSRTCRRQGNGPSVGTDQCATSASPAAPCSGRIGLATGTRLRHDTAVHHATSKQGRFGLTFSDSHASLTDVVQPARPPIDHDSHTAIQHGPNDPP